MGNGAGDCSRARGAEHARATELSHAIELDPLAAWLRDDLRASSVVYLGDDFIDEDAFTLGLQQPTTFLGIRVGHHPSSRAPHFIPDQRSIDLLLQRLVAITETVRPQAER